MRAIVPSAVHRPDSVQKDTVLLRGATILGSLLNLKRQVVTILVVSATIPAHAESLEASAYEAMRLCAALDAISVDQCYDMSAKTAAQREAQRAASKLLAVHAAYIGACRLGYVTCELQARQQVEKGFSAALEPAQALSLPRSDLRR